MASTFLESGQRGPGGSAIDAPLAALVGLSVAFVAFVMPADILARLVEASQLPSILPAAEPPLGAKARAAFCLVAAALSFAAVFMLLRSLDGNRPRPRRPEPQAETETPRLRRVDGHPDAPPRRPLLAGRDLGEPEPSEGARSPAPFRHPDDFPAEPEPAQAPDPALDEELELGGPGIEVLDSPAPLADALAADMPARGPADGNSIADLMARLEQGLARRLGQGRRLPDRTPIEPSAPPGDRDDRLRNAIENLQKMAARNG